MEKLHDSLLPRKFGYKDGNYTKFGENSPFLYIKVYKEFGKCDSLLGKSNVFPALSVPEKSKKKDESQGGCLEWQDQSLPPQCPLGNRPPRTKESSRWWS